MFRRLLCKAGSGSRERHASSRAPEPSLAPAEPELAHQSSDPALTSLVSLLDGSELSIPPRSTAWAAHLLSKGQLWSSVSGTPEIALEDAQLDGASSQELRAVLHDNALFAGGLRSLRLTRCELGGRAAAAQLLETLADRAPALRSLSLADSVPANCGQLRVLTGSVSPPDASTGACEFHMWSTTVAREVALSRGIWYYEVHFAALREHEYTQIGWADPERFSCARFVDGVGDDAHSWAFDGVRMSIWHAGCDEEWGAPVGVGDVLCCVADMDQRTVSFGLNGDFDAPMGRAFDLPSRLVALCPAVTAGKRVRLAVNFGARHFAFPPPENIRPVSEWARAHMTRVTNDLALRLAELPSACGLRELDLSGNALGAHGCEALVSALAARGRGLRVLGLARNGVGAEAVEGLRALLLGGDLCELDVSGNVGLGAAGRVLGAALADPACQLRVLRIGDCALAGAEAEALASGVADASAMRELHAGGSTPHSVNSNAMPASAVRELLSRSSPLRVLDLNGAVHALVDVFDDDDKDMNPAAPHLERLGLRGLRSLDNSADAVAALAGLPRLAHLDLSQLDSRDALPAVCVVLQNCRLRSLALRGCKLDAARTAVLAASGAAPCATLEALDVGDNPMDWTGCAALLRACPQLRELTADMTLAEPDLPDTARARIASAASLGSRRSAHSSKSASDPLADFCAALAKHKSLERLNVSGADLELADSARALARASAGCASLRALVAADARISAAAAAEMARVLLERAPALRTLDLSRNGAGTTAALLPIACAAELWTELLLDKCSRSPRGDELVGALLSIAPASRGHALASVLLENTASRAVSEQLRAAVAAEPVKRRFMWSAAAREIAQQDLELLRSMLDCIRSATPDSVSDLWTVEHGLHFHDAAQDLVFPNGFRVFDGELAFDGCRGRIELGSDSRVDTYMSLADCSGPVRLGQGLRVAQDFVANSAPRLEQLPRRMRVGASFAVIDCPALGDLPSDIQQAPEQFCLLERCPRVTTLPMSLIEAPGTVALMHTGISDAEMERIQALAHPGVNLRSSNLLFSTVTQRFPDMQAAVFFWRRHAMDPAADLSDARDLPDGDDNNSDDDADRHAPAKPTRRRSSRLSQASGALAALERAEDAADRDPLARALAGTVQAYYRNSLLLFLSKLRLAKEFETAELRVGLARRVMEVLRAVVADASARDGLLMRMADAVDACGDKPVWALNQMKAVMDTCHARGDRDKLRALGRRLMRLGIVHDHAARKVAALVSRYGVSQVDEICVYLGYEVALAEALDLPVSAQQMLFPNVIRISDDELAAAEKEALEVSEDVFESWLAAWPEWQRLQRSDAVASVRWEQLARAAKPKRASRSLTTFLGDPLLDPVVLGRAGPWSLAELLERWVETGMDFNNATWAPDGFLKSLMRVEPAVGGSDASPRSSAAGLASKVMRFSGMRASLTGASRRAENGPD